MEENKDMLNSETELTQNKEEKAPKAKKEKKVKIKKLKNELLFKKGGYSLAVIAIMLAALILFNWLISTLSSRFNLEIDMSKDKVSTISKENADYIKNIKNDISITVCANEDDYVEYMNYYGQNLYNAASDNATDYYTQTVKLINKYADYNKKISVDFIDPQTTEFSKISSKYTGLSYGDIIVSSTSGKTERNKTIGYKDIYELYDENGYAAQGYGAYTISGNKIETALTGAIAYCVSSDSKKIAFLTGHSSGTEPTALSALLKNNNYTVETISDDIINSIPSDYDAVIIAAPSKDFTGAELDAISKFLENDGKLDKGLLYFADASKKYLPNLNDWLGEWGIETSEGILFETNADYQIQGNPTTIYNLTSEDSGLSEQGICATSYNAPMSIGTPADAAVTLTALTNTTETIVVAPVGVSAKWKDYKEKDMGSFSGVIKAQKLVYDDDNNEHKSYVFAFSSIQFTESEWAEYDGVSNKNIVLLCNDTATNVKDTGISFVSKAITNESFADKITTATSYTVLAVFVVALPLIMIICGIIIFIRRKNAR